MSIYGGGSVYGDGSIYGDPAGPVHGDGSLFGGLSIAQPRQARDFIDFIDARTGLESPQIVVTWTLDDLNLAWIDYELRRSARRFPEDLSDGDFRASVSRANDLSAFADLGVDAETVYYYSLFFRYLGPISSPLLFDAPIEKLFTRTAGSYIEQLAGTFSEEALSGTPKALTTDETYLYILDQFGDIEKHRQDTLDLVAVEIITDTTGTDNDIIFANGLLYSTSSSKLYKTDPFDDMSSLGSLDLGDAGPIAFDGTYIYVAHSDGAGSTDIKRIDPVAMTLVDMITLPFDFPTDLAYDQTGLWVLCDDPAGSSLLRVDVNVFALDSTFVLGSTGWGQGLVVAQGSIYVVKGLTTANEIKRIDAELVVEIVNVVNTSVTPFTSIFTDGVHLFVGENGTKIKRYNLDLTGLVDVVVDGILNTDVVGSVSDGQLYFVSFAPASVSSVEIVSMLQRRPRLTQRIWFAGTDLLNREVVVRYSTDSKLVDKLVNLSGILESEESIQAIAFAGDPSEFDLVQVHLDTMAIVTNLRHIWFFVKDAPTSSDIISEFDLSDTSDVRMKAGYEITGAVWEHDWTGPGGIGDFASVRILDKANREVRLFDRAGTFIRTISLEGLFFGDSLSGVAMDTIGAASETLMVIAADTKIFHFKSSATGSLINSDIQKTSYVRDAVKSDIGWFRDLAGVGNIMLSETGIDKIQIYEDLMDSLFGTSVAERYLPDTGTVALYHLEGVVDPVFDESINADHGLGFGAALTRSEDGKFGNGFRVSDTTSGVESTIADFVTVSAAGTVEIWFRAEDLSTWTPGAFRKYMCHAANGSGNEVAINLETDGTMRFRTALATVAEAFVTAPGDLLWHHYAIVWDVGSMDAYIDGVLVASPFRSTSPSAGAVTAVIGNNTAHDRGWVGFYDEFRISSVARVPFADVTLVSGPHRAHTSSGRDYDSSSQFPYRDKLQDFLPPFSIRNEFAPAQIVRPEVVEDQEVIFRTSPLLTKVEEDIFRRDNMTLGDIRRVARLVGLMLDRAVDLRTFYLDNYLDIDEMDVDFLETVGRFLGVSDFDTSWNVDFKRRYVKMLREVFSRMGRADAFDILVRTLGHRLILTTIFPRRAFNSGIPMNTGVPLNSVGPQAPLALTNLSFYEESLADTDGVTGLPTSREFSSAAGGFLLGVVPGSLLRITDKTDTDDNGNYNVALVVSDTILMVDRDIPVGSLTGLTFTIDWRIPPPDPLAVDLLRRVTNVAATGLNLQHGSF